MQESLSSTIEQNGASGCDDATDFSCDPCNVRAELERIRERHLLHAESALCGGDSLASMIMKSGVLLKRSVKGATAAR
jgi:hypothetical protein